METVNLQTTSLSNEGLLFTVQSDHPKPQQKIITFRPLPESGMLEFKQWLQCEAWSELYALETAHEKADLFHQTLFEKLNSCLPEQTIKIRPDDKQWVNNEIKKMDRSMKREFRKHKKSDKWTTMKEKFEEKCKQAKQSYSKNIVNDLKMSNPSQWHSKIKGIQTI